MSANERIGKLEALLARVQSRAGAPRAPTNGAAYAAPPPAEATVEETEEVHARAPETQPPITQVEPPGLDAEVEVSTEVVEVDIDVDEPIAMESGAQPVGQQTLPPDELEEVGEEAPPTAQPSDIAAASALANEIEEPTPSSSRRPIAAEAEAETYEEESAPRHTPPPESGKQVAAPSVHPAPRKSSIPPPPPSLEGHTLIGGWREPGLAQGAPGASPHGPHQGVRVPGPPPERPAPAPPQASGPRLSPDVTRPNLPTAAKVATIEGAAPPPKPATAGELLDLTLSL
ncbi:MAG: hypothetical protein KF819_19795 [Labilithrix sp.]|nr:hypothetical protein [Labilithrix sp.]